MSVRLIVRSRAETDLAKASQWYEQRADFHGLRIESRHNVRSQIVAGNVGW